MQLMWETIIGSAIGAIIGVVVVVGVWWVCDWLFDARAT
jgi:hypothetical protein